MSLFRLFGCLFLAAFLFGLHPSGAWAASCGGKNQRPCKLWERIPSCNSGLVEDFLKNRCVAKAVPGRDCGRRNQRPCLLWERVPSCNKGLVEDFSKNRCVVAAVPGKDCGNANQRPCTILERIPSCNVNLVEDFAAGLCKAVSCGKPGGRPCTVVERIPSCDRGLVEDFLANRCIPSADYKRFQLAEKTLVDIGGFIIGKLGFADAVANDRDVTRALEGGQTAGLSRAFDARAFGDRSLPDGRLLRTFTVGAMAGARFIFVGTSGSAGAAIDMDHARPVMAYASGDYSWGPGLGGGGGIDLGFWICRNDKIGGDVWGVEFGLDDFFAAGKLVGSGDIKKWKEVKKAFKATGGSFNVGLWFDYADRFQGFTITPGVGVGLDFGGVLYASTAVEDDPDATCEGGAVNPPPAPPPAVTVDNALHLGQRRHVQNIALGSGHIRHERIDTILPAGRARVCLINSTRRVKALTHAVAGINPLVARPGKSSCATFSSTIRLNFNFVDDGRVIKKDGMNMGYYDRDIVVFDWK